MKYLIGVIAVVLACWFGSSVWHVISDNSGNTSNPTLSSVCSPDGSENGDVAYTLTLTNDYSQGIEVNSVAVVFSNSDGEIGADNPATDINGNSYGLTFIGAGDSVILDMETSVVSGAVGLWSCALGQWSEG
jgi:hypothetical protein